MDISYKNWKVNIDENSIMWLEFDREDSNVNTINQEILDELNKVLSEIEQNPSVKGLVITSAKESGFIAGADVTEFTKLTDMSQAREFIEQAHGVFNRLSNLQMPTVAMIKGFCLGGGCELSLACDYRIAASDEKTMLGLPEIKLGIIPGWGGSVRLPQLIGFVSALPLIMAGKVVPAKKAKALGMVDALVPFRHFKSAAEQFILNPPKKQSAPKWQQLLNFKFFRPMLAHYFSYQLKKKVNQTHYPAPFVVLRNWLKYGAEGKKAFEAEIEGILELLQTPTAKSLLRVFFLQTRLKGLAKGAKYPVKYVHVIGSGTMGGDIAAWCALQGFYVTMQDQEPEYIAPAIKRAHKLFQKKLRDPRKVRAAMDRLIPDLDGNGIKRADVIIEAIVENLKIKQAVFKKIESQAKPDAILATNTSSIPLEEISTVLKNPERLVGIHFFNPVFFYALS